MSTISEKVFNAIDNNNNVNTNLTTQIAGEDLTNDVLKVEQRFSYAAVSSLSTVAVKSGAGFLHAIDIGLPSLATVVIYDNTVPSGTIIHRFASGYPMGSHPLNVSFSTGLTVDTTAGVIIPQILVSYR